jgi:hypothetical protein
VVEFAINQGLAKVGRSLAGAARQVRGWVSLANGDAWQIANIKTS